MSEQPWISVAKEHPPEEACVWIFGDHGVWLGWRERQLFFSNESLPAQVIENVTHWMSVDRPKPPEKR